MNIVDTPEFWKTVAKHMQDKIRSYKYWDEDVQAIVDERDALDLKLKRLATALTSSGTDEEILKAARFVLDIYDPDIEDIRIDHQEYGALLDYYEACKMNTLALVQLMISEGDDDQPEEKITEARTQYIRAFSATLNAEKEIKRARKAREERVY